MAIISADPRPRKPGATPDDTQIIEEEGDPPDPCEVTPDPDAPAQPDSLDWLEPEVPPMHDAVFFSLADFSRPLQLVDLRSGKIHGVFPNLEKGLGAARALKLRKFAFKFQRGVA